LPPAPSPPSVDPDVGECTQCDTRTNANCTGVAPIPLSGYWTSHPRSPLVHRCLVDAACDRKAHAKIAGLRALGLNDAGDAMFDWAMRHRDKSIAELNAANGTAGPLFKEWWGLECSRGYQVRRQGGSQTALEAGVQWC
jgi:hypothetical protein